MDSAEKHALTYLLFAICYLLFGPSLRRASAASLRFTNNSERKVHMARRDRKVRMARREQDRKVRTVWDRKARTRELFGRRVRLPRFDHQCARSEANQSMLEICRSHPLCFHLAPRPLVRDNNRGEQAPSGPWPLHVGGLLHQELVYTTVRLLHKTVLHTDFRSSLHRKVLGCILGAAVRFLVSLRSAPALPPEAPDKSGFDAAPSAEPAPKA